MNFASAYLLVSHGSRDPRSQAAVEQLAQLVLKNLQTHQQIKQTPAYAPLLRRSKEFTHPEQLSSTTFGGDVIGFTGSPPLVGTAYLELSLLPLHEQIRKFSISAGLVGLNNIQIMPLFLLPGVHVMEDLPAELAMAQQDLSPDISLHLRPYLGSHPRLASLLQTQISTSTEARILLAHGSRRPGSSQPVEAIATHLGAIVAYWFKPSDLERCIQTWVSAGYRQIAIIPYFLFEGTITDAISESIQSLSSKFSQVELYLADPIGPSAELANLVIELIED